MYARSVNPEIDATVITKLNYENGYIDIRLVGAKEDGIESNVTGSFMISRSDDKSDFTIWDEITKFSLVGQVPSSWSWRDMTIEHGVKYRYALQQYNENELYSEKILSIYYDDDGNEVVGPIEAYFEDAFLYDGKIQLKIKYNPRVSSFKTDLMETKIDTIGSKYPFIFRNSAVEYKEFPISGLISYLSDDENLFISDEELDLTKNFTDWKRTTTFSPDLNNVSEDYFFDLMNYSDIPQADVEQMREGWWLHQEQAKQIEEAKQRTTDLLDYNMAAERAFKLKVLDWLNNGKIKLFRSPAEGNYIVRLMNVSLAPEDRLGRMLHTFSCTAYEIADCTYDNLMSYNLMETSFIFSRTYKTETVPLIKDNNDNFDTRYEPIGNGYYVIKDEILPRGKEVVGVRFEDIPYGYSSETDTNITIMTSSNTDNILVKGSNPSFPIEMGLRFYSVKISEYLNQYLKENISLQVVPQVHVEYYEIADSLFNTVTNIILDSPPASQWLGSTKHIKTKYLNDDEIEELEKEATVLKIQEDEDLIFHRKVYYQSDNLLDVLNSNKQTVVRFLYARFFKREILDEEMDNPNEITWEYKPSGSGSAYEQSKFITNRYTGQQINLHANNANSSLDKDYLYKFILPKGKKIYAPSYTGGTENHGTVQVGPFEKDLILYYDVTHPYVIYYDNYYFEANKSQYSPNPTKLYLTSNDLRKIERFNDSFGITKLEPYDATFSINDGHDISVTYVDNEGNTILERFRSKPFIADKIRLGCGVGLNYSVEAQTLSYYIEDKSKVLHNATDKNNNYYQLYNNCVDIINQYMSIELGDMELDSPPTQTDIDRAYVLLNWVFGYTITSTERTKTTQLNGRMFEAGSERLYLPDKGFTVVNLNGLKENAYLQIDKELAKWKEETLY